MTVVVDVLRASTTLACMCTAGARRIYVTAAVEDARRLAAQLQGCILAGERGGVPPAGFTLGNSPLEALGARLHGKRVVFTSTTGAQRLAQLDRACEVLTGAPVNARAVTRLAYRLAKASSRPIVVLAAGSEAQPPVFPLEDWAAGVFRLERLGKLGAHVVATPEYAQFSAEVASEGLLQVFRRSEHAEKLARLGLADDVWFASLADLFDVVPWRTTVRPPVPLENLTGCVLLPRRVAGG